ncbi:MAG TPA: OsmC family protein [Micromonosporaceae bacterium]|nr:OsmC family protein [Micromonosporaceae bacterium]
MAQAQPAAAPAVPVPGESMEVRFRAGERYDVTVRGHGFSVDQPPDAGGADGAPTPTELFVASLATCVAFYAGRYLTRHGHSRDGLGVSVTYRMASDRPARVSDIALTVRVPESLPPERWPALQAVATHCTVHNSIVMPPAVRIELAGRAPRVG